MKFFVWTVSLIIFALLLTIIRETGFLLGGVPMALLTLLWYFVTDRCCKAIMHRKEEKQGPAREAAETQTDDFSV